MTLLEILRKFNCLTVVKYPKTKLLGREKETAILVESFYKKRMNNAILVGKAGVGKTAILEEFARIMKDKYIVLELNVASSVGGTQYRGQFEEKISKSLDAIKKYNADESNKKKIVLFIDEIHTIGNVGASEGGMNLGNIVKPYLSKGEISIIGATTLYEYNMTIKKDPALIRRLSPIYIKELDKEAIISIMESFSKKKVKKELIEYIYEKSLTLEDYCNPDASIEILDRCMARKEYLDIKINEEMVDDIVEMLII